MLGGNGRKLISTVVIGYVFKFRLWSTQNIIFYYGIAFVVLCLKSGKRNEFEVNQLKRDVSVRLTYCFKNESTDLVAA